MHVRRVRWIGGVLLLGVSGCLRTFVPAPFGTPVDEVCNPMNGTFRVPFDTVEFHELRLPLPKSWGVHQRTASDLELRRVDAELHVWRTPRWFFPAVEPRTSTRCSIQRGDTLIEIHAIRLQGFDYRVDVTTNVNVDGQPLFLQLQTRYVDHLRQMRATLDQLFFVSAAPAPRRRE
jgi:hypothetical protein